MENKALVLSTSYEPLSITSMRKAFLLVYMEKAEVIDFSGSTIRSASSEYELPSIIRLKIRPKYNFYNKVELNRKNIFKRDNNQCQYCGSKDNLTVDHVIPKSKGGVSSWDNLVTACSKCNNKKDNKFLTEVGMNLSSQPKRPSYVHFLIRKKNIKESWKPYLFLK